MPRIRTIVFTATLLLVALAPLSACGARLRSVTRDQLHARSLAYEAEAELHRQHIADQLLKRLLDKRSKTPADQPVVVNVLSLSSGGQFGAFGVGVLQGWSRDSHAEIPQPEFDVVTGVSTGALIAPFALLGTHESIERIDQLYLQIDNSFATIRGWLFFLPRNRSFFKNTNLANRIKKEIDTQTIAAMAEAHRKNRILLIGATDLDLGRFRIWDLGQMAEDVQVSNDPSRLHQAMLSSAAIPAAFPPVEIDGALYADGAASQAAFVGLDLDQIEDTVAEYVHRTNDQPPHFRFWVIVNGQIDTKMGRTDLGWINIASRSLATLSSYSLRTTLRHLEFGCEVLARRMNSTVEFRYINVPDHIEIEVKENILFDHELMVRMAELGRVMGAEGTHWRSTIGAPEIPGSESSVRKLYQRAHPPAK